MYKGGGTQHIDDVIAHAHSDYQVAAALRFEIFMKFLSLLAILWWVISLSVS